MKKVIFVVLALLTMASSALLALNHLALAKEEAHSKLTTTLRVPPDLSIKRFSDLSALGKPRMLAAMPNGGLLVTMVDTGLVVRIDQAGKPTIIASGLNAPNGIVIRETDLLVAETDRIVRLPKLGETWGQPQAFITGLPTGGHALKSIKQGPDGFLYVNVGSSCNVCVEEDPRRATLLRYDASGKPAGALVTLGRHSQSAIWARGLRNSQGFAWHPVTGALFATNEGADNRSDQINGPVNDALPPEHLNMISAGEHYGWPYCWGDPQSQGSLVQDPNVTSDGEICRQGKGPVLTFESHSTPIGITFLHNSRLPNSYREDAVVALHGSWNRKQPSGYRLVRVQFRNHQPTAVVSLVDGWLSNGRAWGRPVDVAVGSDGMLYISDDLTGWIYKLSPAQHA